MVNQAKQAFVVVGGLLRQADSVLLVRQQKPNDPELKWALPGGYVERDESLLDALRREVREETGLDAQFVPVEEAIQRLEQGFRFANEPAIEHLMGNSPPGAVWTYHRDPAAGDHLVEYIP